MSVGSEVEGNGLKKSTMQILLLSNQNLKTLKQIVEQIKRKKFVIIH